MSEQYRAPAPNEALLSSLFGTPEELQAEAVRRQAESEAERYALAPDTVEQMPFIEDDWESEGIFIG